MILRQIIKNYRLLSVTPKNERAGKIQQLNRSLEITRMF